MKCDVHEADLSALLDGELPALEERRLRDHLGVCRECRAEYRELGKISTAMREIEAAAEPARSPKFIDRVVSAAAVRPRRRAAPVPRIIRFPSSLVAAAVLLLLVGLSVAVLSASLSPVSLDRHTPMTDGSAAAVVARGQAIENATAALRARDPLEFTPLTLTDLGEPGPELPDPAAFRRSPDPLTGDELYQSLGLARAGGRWLSGTAYRRMADHLAQEELLAHAAAMKAAKPEVPHLTGGNAVSAWVGSLTPGLAVTHASLTLVPLLDGDGETGVELADVTEALDRGFLTIREDRSSGSLAAENSDEARHVFIPAGTLLVGGYQDRIITRDTLLPPKTRARLPVMCCEEGRSVGESFLFTRSPGLAPPDIRAILVRTRRQEEVWERIRANLDELGARSRTFALRTVFERGRGARSLDDYSKALAAALTDPRTVGLLAYHDGEFVAGDIFSSHALLLVMAERLTTAYVFDSVRRDAGDAQVATGFLQPGEVLAAVTRASFLRTPGAVGGQETGLFGGISGSALIPVADAVPLHVALFPETPARDGGESGAKTRDGGASRPAAPPPVGPAAEPTSGEAKRRLDERRAERRAGGNRPRELTPPKRPRNPPPGREPDGDRRIPDPR